MPGFEERDQWNRLAGLSMIKKAYGIQMSYDVSNLEKRQAELALIHFSHAQKLLNMASEHLNIMKTPFKDSPDMNPSDIVKARVAIRRFRDKAIENFNEFKTAAFKCINIMQNFSSDPQTVKLVKSFIASVDDLESKVNEFADLFNNLQAKDFVPNVVSDIEEIQKQCEDIEEIIDERVKSHIRSNILASSWVDSVSDELQIKVEKKTPLLLDLYNKRQEQLNQALKESVENQ